MGVGAQAERRYNGKRFVSVDRVSSLYIVKKKRRDGGGWLIFHECVSSAGCQRWHFLFSCLLSYHSITFLSWVDLFGPGRLPYTQLSFFLSSLFFHLSFLR